MRELLLNTSYNYNCRNMDIFTEIGHWNIPEINFILLKTLYSSIDKSHNWLKIWQNNLIFFIQHTRAINSRGINKFNMKNAW